jgi:plastocyanin
LALVVVLGAGACSSSKSSSTTASTTPSAAGAQTYTVQLDGNSSFNGVFTAFFPNDLSAHPGDTIDFTLPHFSGEPHTIAMGTLVDAAVAKLAQLGPKATVAQQEDSPEMLKLPDVFPHQVGNGPPDANQSAGQPCFLATGIPPLSLTGGAPACPKVAQPDFDGTQSFYDSGVLQQDGDHYTVKLSPNIKPGTYSLMCMIHREAMTAKFTVAPSSATVGSPADQAARGQQQLNQLISAMAPLAANAQQPHGTTVQAGLVNPQYFNALVAQFSPKSISIPVGGSVTWNWNGFHSVSFNSTPADVGAFTKAADGSIHLAKGGAPAGINTPPAAFVFPPPDNGKPIAIDGGQWDGTGFRNTGIVGSLGPPVFITFKQTFTRAGTYTFRCLFHPNMEGTVKVG